MITRPIPIVWLVFLLTAQVLIDALLLHLLSSHRPHLKQRKLQRALELLVKLDVEHVSYLGLDHAVLKSIIVVKVY